MLMFPKLLNYLSCLQQALLTLWPYAVVSDIILESSPCFIYFETHRFVSQTHQSS